MSGIIEHNVPLTKIACNSCKHYYWVVDKFSCKAFDSIPHEILIGDNMHTEPLPGQKNNIIYEEE